MRTISTHTPPSLICQPLCLLEGRRRGQIALVAGSLLMIVKVRPLRRLVRSLVKLFIFIPPVQLLPSSRHKHKNKPLELIDNATYNHLPSSSSSTIAGLREIQWPINADREAITTMMLHYRGWQTLCDLVNHNHHLSDRIRRHNKAGTKKKVANTARFDRVARRTDARV